MTILALDVGEVRIGIASWDETRGVRDEGHLRRSSRSGDVRRLVGMASERGATVLVVGLPLNMDGSEGPQARRSRRFARELAEISGIPLVFQNEYDSSNEALQELGLGGRPLEERERGRVDSRAAAIALRRYLSGLERHPTD